MCGFAGLLDPRRSRAADPTVEILTAMSVPMVPRGPDADGAWVDPEFGVGLVHRRLSILDLSPQGAQPMHSADGRWVVSYNGEIYNHLELAADLRNLGVSFRGHSDTEIFLEAVSAWGLAATLGRIDGMYALALWDRREHTLTLLRDRMGEKPLYYGALGTGEVVFGSSLDALRAHPDFDRPVDRDALALYFRHKYVPAPFSIFKGIRKLDPGCTVTIGADGTVGPPVPYWSVFDVASRGQTWHGSPDEAVDHFEDLLRTSVRRRMIADVPVGAFLSGGVDSSTVVAVAQEESSSPVRTFTIGSTNADFDESSDAKAVAEHLGCDHTELVVTGEDALAVVDQLGAIYDEPFGDSSQIPTRLVSELARSQVTVALSGDAGDELFGGYNRYVWVPTIWNRIGGVPVGLRRAGARAGRMVPPSWWDRAASVLPRSRRPQQLGLKVSKVLDVADAATAEAVFARLVSHWDDPDSLVRGGREPLTSHNDPSQQPDAADIVELMMLVDAVTYLPDDILAKVDRAAMSVSLETRIPLLDRDIVEFAVGLPSELYIRDGKTKWPLRQVLSRHVPDELIDRPKAGFGLPIDEWLRGPLKDWALDHLRGPECAEFLNTALVERAWADHQSGRRNLAYELWDVLMFSVWCRERGITA